MNYETMETDEGKIIRFNIEYRLDRRQIRANKSIKHSRTDKKYSLILNV